MMSIGDSLAVLREGLAVSGVRVAHFRYTIYRVAEDLIGRVLLQNTVLALVPGDMSTNISKSSSLEDPLA